MPSVGIHPETGKVIVGWERTSASLVKCITTELRSRVERRDFGSNVPNLLDKPQNDEAVMDFYMAVVEAIEPRFVNGRVYGEPCFELSDISLDLSDIANPVIALNGVEYPDAHLGDFTKARKRRLDLSDYFQ
jgi:phage baseplate assembly protein W